MAAFQKAGVELVVRNFNTFMRQLGQAERGINAFGGAPAQSIGLLGRFGGVLGNIGQIAAGIISANVLGRIFSQLTDIGSAALEATKDFQVLQIRLEGLVAQQVRAADATLSVEDSYRRASGAASGYLDWVKQIAVTTPFGVQEIANTFTLAQAYGFMAGESQVLTQAIIDFASGMGLTDFQMRRIIENFGQMRAAGKLMGTEMRDLARGSFVPVNEVLQIMADDLGVVTGDMQEFRKQAAEGGVDVDAFFNAFIKLAGTDFPGAAERMARTWRGVTNNIRDFIETVVGADVLGPIMDSTARIAANALDTLLSPAVREAAQLIGQTLGLSFDRIFNAISTQYIPAIRGFWEALGFGLPTIEDIIGGISFLTTKITQAITVFSNFMNTTGRDFATRFRQIALDAFQWGANIAVQLAQGIITGGSNALVAAMNWISNMLAHWLSPGSPPLVARDIDLWGSAAFTEFLRGFTMADFNVLESLQGPLRSALNAFVSLDELSKEQAGDIFVAISERIAKALDTFRETGSVNISNVFADLTGGAATFGAEMEELLRRQLALVSGVEALEEAERQLEASRQAAKAQRAQIRDLTDEYNALLRAGASPAVLEAKLAELNAVEEQEQATLALIDEQEDQVDVLQAQLDPLREAVQLQEALLAQLIEIAQIQSDLATGGAGTGGTSFGGEDIDIPGMEEGGMRQLKKNFEDFFDDLGNTVAQKWREALQPFKDLFIEAVQNVKDTWNNDFLPAMSRAWEELKQRFETGKEEVGRIWRLFLDSLGQIASDIWNTVIVTFFVDRWNSLKELWEDRQEGLVEIWNLFWRQVTDIATGLLAIIEARISEVLSRLKMWWEDHKESVLMILGGLAEFAGFIIDTMMRVITFAFIGMARDVLKTTEEWTGDLLDIYDEKTAQVIDIWMTAFDILGDLFDLFAAVMFLDADLFWQGLQGLWDDGLAQLGNIFEFWGLDFLVTWGKWFIDLLGIPSQIDWKDIGFGIIDGIISGIQEKAHELISEVLAITADALQAVKDFLGIDSPSRVFRGLGQNIMEGLAMGINEMAYMPKLATAQAAIGTVAAAREAAPPVVRQTNVTFGDTILQNNVDAALYLDRIEQIVADRL